MQPTPAEPFEQSSALRLLFQHCPQSEQFRRAVNARALLQAGELKPEGLLVVRSESEISGVILYLCRPGSLALVWPTQICPLRGNEEHHQVLIDEALSQLRSLDVKIAQVLLESHELEQAQPLLRNGFQHVTSLWHLQHFLELPAQYFGATERCIWQTWDQTNPEVFQETLLRSYEGSLDCPEINGARSIEEVLAGHQAEGEFHPERWWLISEKAQPAGVLLMTELPEEEGWEISYVGVVPQARRRGLGKEIVTRALLEAKEAGVIQLTLAVDQRNRPAWKLYRDLGFEPFDQREVLLCLLNELGNELPGV